MTEKPPRTSKSWIIGLTVLAVILAVGIWLATPFVKATLSMPAASHSHPEHTERSESLQPIDIELNARVTEKALQLRIPRDYLWWRKNWEGGSQKHLYIHTRLPDMEPQPAVFPVKGEVGSAEYDASLTTLKNGVAIHLYAFFVNENSYKRIFESLKKHSKLINEDVHGMHHFRRQICNEGEGKFEGGEVPSETRCRSLEIDEFIFPPEKAETKISFYCTSLEKDSLGSCTASVPYRGRLLSYTFRRTELYRWKDFDAKVSQLLDSFVVDG